MNALSMTAHPFSRPTIVHILHLSFGARFIHSCYTFLVRTQRRSSAFDLGRRLDFFGGPAIVTLDDDAVDDMVDRDARATAPIASLSLLML